MIPAKEEVIDLDSPPPSPTDICLDDPPSVFDQKDADYQVLSPQKRARNYSARSRQPKRKRPAISIEAMSEMQADDAHLDFAPAVASDTPTHSPSPPIQAGDDASPMGYHEYAESVNADIAGVYLINSNLFVVQGWDSRTLTATVSYTYREKDESHPQVIAFMVPFTT